MRARSHTTFAGNTTVVEAALPPKSHPIWTMGPAHVAVAHAVCAAFAAIGRRYLKVK